MENFQSVPPLEPPPMPQPAFSDLDFEKPKVQISNKFNLKKVMLILIIVIICFTLVGTGYYIFVVKKNNGNNDTTKTTSTSSQPISVTPVSKKGIKTQSEVEDERRRASIKDLIQPALQLYLTENKFYPDTLDALIPKYLNKMPLDPVKQKEYSYKVSSDKLRYTLSAILDDGSTFSVSSP